MARRRSKQKPKRPKVFYAYPADPKSVEEVIKNAISHINNRIPQNEPRTRFNLWSDISGSGKMLLDSILSEIDRSDVFACDLTYPNTNVSFELGYAIARFKRVWISLNRTVNDAPTNFKRIYYQLIPVAYAAYTNSADLAIRYLDSPPTDSLDSTILGEFYKTAKPRREIPTLLYCKPWYSTEAIRLCAAELESSPFKAGLVIDDPAENPSPTLDWYTRQIVHADAVLIHLLSAEEQDSWEHNIKCSLVAGLAKGFQRQLLMVAKQPFDPPVDYSSLLFTHETAQEAANAVSTWSTRLPQSLPDRRRRRTPTPSDQSTGLDIRHLNIGDSVAENERANIDTYFLETSAFTRAMDEPFTIVSGRQGTGKSAQLYAMEAALNSDSRNAAFVIKPVGYEMAGLFRLVRALMNTSERGYLIASLWKYLIYSELVKSIYTQIMSRPEYYEMTTAEDRLVRYFQANQAFLSPPFSERLDRAVRALHATITGNDALEQRQRISEHLHVTRIGHLRRLIASALQPFQRVHVLVDNLDEPWKREDAADVAIFANVLAGLFQVSTDIISDFGSARAARPSLNTYITIFLRSDILAVVQPMIGQFDKYPIQRINWHDSNLLRSLIDLRFRFSVGHGSRSHHVWARLFPSHVRGVPIWQYIDLAILPRPRDLLYLIRQAIDEAINHGNDSITEDNFVRARSRYSEYVFQSIVAEDDPRRGRLEHVLFEFAGSSQAVSRQDLQTILSTAGVEESDVEFYIALLCDINFLEIEDNREFRLVRDEADRRLKRRIARTAARRTRREERFQIAEPFVPVLGVQ